MAGGMFILFYNSKYILQLYFMAKTSRPDHLLLLLMWDCTQSLPILGTENKTVQAWLPKANNQHARENPNTTSINKIQLGIF